MHSHETREPGVAPCSALLCHAGAAHAFTEAVLRMEMASRQPLTSALPLVGRCTIEGC